MKFQKKKLNKYICLNVLLKKSFSLFVSIQVDEYKEAEAAAKKDHLGVWEYGDITEDDAKEFGRN